MDTYPEVELDKTDQLVALMEAITAGDRAAVVTLYTEFGDRIAGSVRRRLRELGIYNPGEQQVQDLVLDACFELEGCAKGWNPAGGALPWNWARLRINAMITRSVGIFTDQLDETRAAQFPDEVGSACADAGLTATKLLDELATRDDRARLLADAFAAAQVSPRDRAVILEYVLQGKSGDRAPARTVGVEFGLEPANIRQIVKRTRSKLSGYARMESRYQTIADLPLLAS